MVAPTDICTLLNPTREEKTVKKRRIASLGNIDDYSEQEIQQFIRTLESPLQNRLIALQDRLEKPHRGRNTSTQSVMLKVSEILTKKGVQAFLEVEYIDEKISYTRNEEAPAKEALREGNFVIKTNTKLPADQVVTSHKTSMNVERAFREIRNFLDVGPVYHWNEKRIHGHIFICVLAYLFEQEIQVMYRSWWERREHELKQITDGAERGKQLEELKERWYTGERITKDLSRWHVLQAEFLGKEVLLAATTRRCPEGAKHSTAYQGNSSEEHRASSTA